MLLYNDVESRVRRQYKDAATIRWHPNISASFRIQLATSKDLFADRLKHITRKQERTVFLIYLLPLRDTRHVQLVPPEFVRNAALF